MPHNHDHKHTLNHGSGAQVEALNPRQNQGYRKVLWIALVLNAVMFVIEVTAGRRADSSALLADSADFLADAFNYGVTLWALTQAATARAKTALVKGWFMIAYGLAVLVQAVWSLLHGSSPEAFTMAWVSMLAFATNLLVAYLFYAFRASEANMRAVWLDARNDVFGNMAVFAAAVLVWFTATPWADLLVALFMAALACKTGWMVIRHANDELNAS
jgi:cation diffusion facilitator family transporter